MKINKQQLKQIIAEELQKTLEEEPIDEFINPFKKKQTPLGKTRNDTQIALDVVQRLANERDPTLKDAFRKVIIKLQAELSRATPQGATALQETVQDSE